jgi:hypothetical protein
MLADQINTADYAASFNVKFSGYTGTTTLADFPALVRLSATRNGFDYAKCAADGSDIRFTDADGNLIPHEIDTWDPTGESLVWVKVAALNRRTVVRCFYGYQGADAQPAVSSTDVWSNGYVGVWHLGESALPLRESSGTSTDFTESADGNETLGASGAVGGAVDFAAGTVNSRLLAPDDDDLDEFDDFTVEMWTKQESAMPSSANGGYQPYLLTKVASGEYAYIFYQNTVTANGVFRVGNGSGNANISGSAMIPAMNEWNHQVVVRDTTAQKAYCYMSGLPAPEGGIALSDGYGVTIPDSSSPLYLGNAQTTANNKAFPGQIDELRISRVARSAAWVKATHDTVASASFARYSATRATDSATIFYVR